MGGTDGWMCAACGRRYSHTDGNSPLCSSCRYNHHAKFPFYGELGLNSGVMLMHLERMRTTGWEDEMRRLKAAWGRRVVYGDQDLINIFFADHPERLFLYPCMWNYRTDHCSYGQVGWLVSRLGG